MLIYLYCITHIRHLPERQWPCMNAGIYLIKSFVIMNYKVRERVIPRGVEGTRKYYASVVPAEVVELKDVAKHTSMLSTVSRTDCTAVLTAMLEVVPLDPLKGNLVRLGDLGSFIVTINSSEIENTGVFRNDDIKKAKVRF